MTRLKLFAPFAWKVLSLTSLTLLVTLAGYCHGQVTLEKAPDKATVAKSAETRSVQVGQAFPNFELKDQNGNLFSLKTTLKKGPVVLVVYRSADW